MIELQKNLQININSKPGEEKFYKKWINKLEYINTTMRAIRKVQNRDTGGTERAQGGKESGVYCLEGRVRGAQNRIQHCC